MGKITDYSHRYPDLCKIAQHNRKFISVLTWTPCEACGKHFSECPLKVVSTRELDLKDDAARNRIDYPSDF